MKKHIANITTGCRIFGSALLLFFPVFSVQFYILYFFCGFTDMIDGTIARKTNSTSPFGAKLDTIADFVFVFVCSIKILPTLQIPLWLWVWIFIVALVKIFYIALVFIHKKKLLSIHSILNKITGFALFLLPLSLSFVEIKYSSVVVCLIATFSSIQEVYYIRIGRELLNIY